MKKMKMSLLALFAVVIAIGLSAFTSESSSPKPPTQEWFIYKTGSPDPALASSYNYYGPADPMCANTNVLCAIKVLSDGNGHINQSSLDAFAVSPGFSNKVAGKVEFRN